MTEEQVPIDYMKQVEAELAEARTRSSEQNLAIHGQQQLLNHENEENLIKWQLDLREDKEVIKRLLQGIKEEEDEEGNIIYKVPTDIKEIPFSDYGVSMMLQWINYYLTKNTILSNYSDKVIEWKVYDFGNDLNDYIHNNYHELFRIPTFQEAKEILMQRYKDRRKEIKDICEDFFGDIPKEEIINDLARIEEGYQNIVNQIRDIQNDYRREKIKMVPLLVGAIVNMVHSAYLRAYHGGERESLRTARTVTQTEPLSRNILPNQMVNPARKKNWFNTMMGT